MAVGTISTRILTDIANAIRYKAGVATTYKPGQMAAAVAALDGTDAGQYQAQPYMALESGVLSEHVFEDIADAIRGQNGLSTQYQPGDMAAAILALEWDVGYKVRALLLADGTLEFNYYDRRRTVYGGTIQQVFEVDTSGYSSASARSWDSIKLLVTRVYIDSSIASVGITNCAYWFNAFSNCTEVVGFENLSGITNATQMFTSCSSLETIWATSFTNAITSGTSMFYGCNKLVGGTDGFVPTSTSSYSVCKLGVGGVLTNPSADGREWFKVFVYDDGLLEFTTAGTADATRTLLDSGRMCANAKYQAIGVIPGYSYRAQFRTVQFKADMAGLSLTNMCYWLYGLTAITSVTGWANLSNVTSMRYAMNGCTGVTSLDLRGMDPSSLTDLFYAFAGCSALTTIYADSTWALPSTVSGSGTFYNCRNIVGGNGTAYSTSAYEYARMVIDRVGQAGYLTAA